MSFSEVKKEIFDSVEASKRTTFSESAFNRLTSALVNEAGYEVKVAKAKGDEVVEEIITPVAEFRKAVIGGIAKSAGADDAEVAKLVEKYKFASTTPWYPIVSEAITASMEAGKSFTFIPKADMRASLRMENKEEAIKMVGGPNTSKDEKVPTVYGAHRRIKCSSACPKNLRKNK